MKILWIASEIIEIKLCKDFLQDARRRDAIGRGIAIAEEHCPGLACCHVLEIEQGLNPSFNHGCINYSLPFKKPFEFSSIIHRVGEGMVIHLILSNSTSGMMMEMKTTSESKGARGVEIPAVNMQARDHGFESKGKVFMHDGLN